MDEMTKNNQKLIQAIQKFAENSTLEAEREVYLALEHAIFLMPAVIENEAYQIISEAERIVEVQAGATLQIAQFTNEDKTLYPAFTDLDEVAKWNNDLASNNVYLIKMDITAYDQLINENKIDGFVINPYHQDIIITDTQFKRYYEILFEEEHKGEYTAPITKLFDELMQNPSLELEDQIYHMFQNLRLLMPVQVPNQSCVLTVTDDGVAELVENTPINVMPLENEQGQHVFPVFTDLYEAKSSGLGANPAENRYLMEINFDGLESLVGMNEHVIGFTINPFTHNVVIGPEQMKKYHAIKGQYHFEYRNSEQRDLMNGLNTTAEEEAKVLSSFRSSPYQLEVNVEEPKLEKALMKYLSSVDSVHKAYLVQKIYGDHNSLLLVIDKERDGKSLVADLKKIANKFLKDETEIEFLSHNEEEAKPIIEQAEPFYVKNQKRKILGIF